MDAMLHQLSHGLNNACKEVNGGNFVRFQQN